MDPVILSWSGGKDSALVLSRLQNLDSTRVVGLVTTVTERYDRISIHGVRRVLLEQQAAAARLPLLEVAIPPQCSNEMYSAAWEAALANPPGEMAEACQIAFGDIFLEDVRTYREDLMSELGFGTLFPLWGDSTRSLATKATGPESLAMVVCVDTESLSASFAGRRYDAAFLSSLPSEVDLCGERGEFHTFVSRSPSFDREIEVEIGETVLRDERFAFCDLLARPPAAPKNSGR